MKGVRTLIVINVLGGLAVLGSYAWGLLSFPETRGLVWGGVPDSLRPFYTASMLTAAAGYFPFTAFILFRAKPETLDQKEPVSSSLINGLYLAVLVPSAIWMPLTFEMIHRPSAGLFGLICLVLAIVAAGSLGLIYVVLRLRQQGPVFFWFALAGVIAFNIQTTLLDALVWTAYFPSSSGL